MLEHYIEINTLHRLSNGMNAGIEFKPQSWELRMNLLYLHRKLKNANHNIFLSSHYKKKKKHLKANE